MAAFSVTAQDDVLAPFIDGFTESFLAPTDAAVGVPGRAGVEAASATDTASRAVLLLSRRTTDTTIGLDIASRSHRGARSVLDVTIATDTVVFVRGAARTISDTAPHADTAVRLAALHHGGSEVVFPADAAFGLLSAARVGSDVSVATDAALETVALVRVLSDANAGIDTIQRVVAPVVHRGILSIDLNDGWTDVWADKFSLGVYAPISYYEEVIVPVTGVQAAGSILKATSHVAVIGVTPGHGEAVYGTSQYGVTDGVWRAPSAGNYRLTAQINGYGLGAFPGSTQTILGFSGGQSSFINDQREMGASSGYAITLIGNATFAQHDTCMLLAFTATGTWWMSGRIGFELIQHLL